jgi:hypothetical protein
VGSFTTWCAREFAGGAVDGGRGGRTGGAPRRQALINTEPKPALFLLFLHRLACFQI